MMIGITSEQELVFIYCAFVVLATYRFRPMAAAALQKSNGNR